MGSKEDDSGWDEAWFLSEVGELEAGVARRLAALLEAENSLPFICRYRKAETGGLDADQLRAAHAVWLQAKAVKAKIQSAKRSLRNTDQLHPNLAAALDRATDLEEIQILVCPFLRSVCIPRSPSASPDGAVQDWGQAIAGRASQIFGHHSGRTLSARRPQNLRFRPT